MTVQPTSYEANPQSLLKNTILFQGMAEATIDSVAQNLEFEHLESGDILFSEGDTGNSLYVVIYGRLRVFMKKVSDGTQVPVKEIGFGETVGEMALITGGTRSATVSAIRDTGLFKFSQEAFEHLVEQHPVTMLHLTRLMVSRLLEGHLEDAHRQFSTLALMPVRDGLPIDNLSKNISRALSEHGPCLCVTSDLVNRALGEGSAQSQPEDMGHKRIAAWLNAQEDAHRFLVFVGDPANSQWSRRCVRHADRILYTAQAGDPASAHPIRHYIETERNQLNRPIEELLLLRSGSNASANTAVWLKRLAVSQHYHLEMGQQGDYRRLIRLLTGKATTLVLGGGGARGFAHIGVLKALQETGRVEIDALGGSSMGSIIAAQIALGWSLDEITERNRKAFTRNKALHDLTLPLVSLLKGRQGDHILEEFFGDTLIEDLNYDFFCVSTNLTRGSVVIHRRGELLPSIRASISVPGILPPVFSAGDILVDGGVLNNLPVDVMQGLHQSEVIAVDVSPVEDLSTRPDFKQCPAPWEILWQQMKPWASAHKVPKIFDILMRSATIASTRAAQKMSREVSLFLHPPTEAFGMTEWDAFDHLVELGYESSRAPIEDWLRGRDAQGETPQNTARTEAAFEPPF